MERPAPPLLTLAALLAASAPPPAAAQEAELVRRCLPGNDRGDGLALAVDAGGDLHLSRVDRVRGDLLYTRIAPDGTFVDEVVAARMSRLLSDEVDDTGLLLDGEQIHICFRDARAQTVEVASRVAGQWRREVVAVDVGAGGECDLAAVAGTLLVVWHGHERLNGAARLGGAWSPAVIDAVPGRDVGGAPALAVGPAGAVAVAYHDATAGALRIAWRDGFLWRAAEATAPGVAVGWKPAAVFDAQGVLSVFHGAVPETPDISADAGLYHTRGRPGGAFVTAAVPETFIGGTIGASRGSAATLVATRRRQRSALFGSADALLLFRVAGDLFGHTTTLEQTGPGQRRHHYRNVRVAHDAHGLPVVAFLDDAPAYGHLPAEAPVCYFRAADADLDGVPDVVDVDGPDPLPDPVDPPGPDPVEPEPEPEPEPPACEPAPEACNGEDDDCDGFVDEGIAPLATRCGSGACAASGQLICVDGILEDTCRPAPPTADDTCDGVDDDCDGRIDEHVPAEPTRCGEGACAVDGQRVCRAGAYVDTCTPAPPAASDATCDGIDDDCDGLVDEDYPVALVRCGLGVCGSIGQRLCIAGRPVNTCVVRPLAAPEVLGNGLDDDCNGLVDERCVGGDCLIGTLP